MGHSKRYFELQTSLFCGLISIIVCTLQNLLGNSGTTFVFDSGHYMGTVQLLCQALHAHLGGPAFNDSIKLSQYLLLDGPLVPLVGTSVFALLGKIPGAVEWRIFVGIEIVFQAIATTCLTLLTFTFCRAQPNSFAKWIPLSTGLAWALYPSAILSTDSFLGELPAAAMILLIMVLLGSVVEKGSESQSSTFTIGLRAAFAGVFLAITFMSKPALILTLVGICISAFLFLVLNGSKKQTITTCFAVVLGAAAALTPWLIFTHATTGHWRPSAYRLPIYNLVRGIDFESDGWGSVPPDAAMQIYGESFSPFTCAREIFSKAPADVLNLLLRKPERLWLFPWNDYHKKCLGVGLGVQIFAHQLMIIIGVVALVLMPLTWRQIRTTHGKFVALTAPLVVLGHITYLPFETSSRYGFTSIAMFFLLTALALKYLSSNLVKHKRLANISLLLIMCITVVALGKLDLLSYLQMILPGPGMAICTESLIRLLSIVLVLWLASKMAPASQKEPVLAILSKLQFASLSLLFLIIIVAHLANSREQRTWKVSLKPGQIVTRQIYYSSNKAVSWKLLIIDCDGKNSEPLQDCKIAINGKEVPGPVFNPNTLIKSWANLGLLQNDMASVLGKPINSIRQWRALAIPADYLVTGSNSIQIRPTKELTIFGATNQLDNKPAFIPSIEYLSPAKILTELESPDGRITSAHCQPMSANCAFNSEPFSSSQNNDLSPAFGKQTGNYRIYVVEGNDDFWQRNNPITTGLVEVF